MQQHITNVYHIIGIVRDQMFINKMWAGIVNKMFLEQKQFKRPGKWKLFIHT